MSTDAEKLDKPAQVGNTAFHVGIPVRMLVERAQREYEFKQNDNLEAARIARSNRVVQAFHLEGALTELVELKGIKEWLDSFPLDGRPPEWQERYADYQARKGRAWE